jgi:hypothetical protein
MKTIDSGRLFTLMTERHALPEFLSLDAWIVSGETRVRPA